MIRYLTLAAIVLSVLSRDLHAATGHQVLYAAIIKGRIEKYELDGTPIGGYSITPPRSVAVDESNYAYVAPLFATPMVWRYGPDGHFANFFPEPTPLDGDSAARLGGSAIGSDGNLYLGVHAPKVRIERFSLDGTSLGIIPIPEPTGTVRSIAFDAAGNMFASTGSVIRKFDPTGVFLGDFAAFSGEASDIAIDSQGNLYAVKGGTAPVMKFGPTGQLLSTFSPGFRALTITVDSQDLLYIGGFNEFLSDQAFIRKFRADGTQLPGFGSLLLGPGPNNSVNDLLIVNEIPEPSCAVVTAISIFGLLVIAPRSRTNNRGRTQKSEELG